MIGPYEWRGVDDEALALGEVLRSLRSARPLKVERGETSLLFWGGLFRPALVQPTLSLVTQGRLEIVRGSGGITVVYDLDLSNHLVFLSIFAAIAVLGLLAASGSIAIATILPAIQWLLSVLFIRIMASIRVEAVIRVAAQRARNALSDVGSMARTQDEALK